MTTKVAPWLDGLGDAWELPPNHQISREASAASRNTDSLRKSSVRIPRRSLSGLPSSLSSHETLSNPSTEKRRKPLASRSSNDAQMPWGDGDETKTSGARSVSIASSGSLPFGTVQQRSKSASPIKTQQTLEWKRRLVHGQVGYGDQTDLFGPSGLENIFAKSKGPENEVPKPQKRMSWLMRSDSSMPSSPPPWPSALNSQTRKPSGEILESVEEEKLSAFAGAASTRSDPFDLENSSDSQLSKPWSADTKSDAQQSTVRDLRDETRTVSGQTELEQEDFSPVFISKHTTVTGRVDYAALDSHLIKQFQSTKVDLRHPSQEESNAQGSDPNDQPGEESAFTDGPESEALPIAPDLSFSENLPTGSPFPNLGQNVQFKRGGYSQYGSFKQKPLSPSQSVAENCVHPSAGGVQSRRMSETQHLPPPSIPLDAPSTPLQSNEPISRSSGSPLKLFGNHDTFTNNRLLRRLSQLNLDGTVAARKVEQSDRGGADIDRKVSSESSFGNGGLDGHAFNAEITITSASDSENDGSDRSPGSEVPVPGSKAPLDFRFEVSPEVQDTFKLKRKLSKHSTATTRVSTLEDKISPARNLQATVEDASEVHLESGQPDAKAVKYNESKRPPTSPFKDPTPKRRRTLHAAELELDVKGVNYSYHAQLQESIRSRKRKDARSGESQNVAEPDILAQRKILRPRNPTPSQRRRQQIEAELRQAAEEFAEQEPERLEAVMEQIESSMASDSPPTLEQRAQTLASEVAAFTLNVQKPSAEYGELKRSVTTQDFLDEAMLVMNLIRSKARPQSLLGSVEESDAEAFNLSLRADGSQQEDSHLRVSRPPSREGSGWRSREPIQIDARIVSHLRKFQEHDERDEPDFIANSIASLPIAEQDHINDQVVVVDELSNIRITGPLIEQGKAQSEDQIGLNRAHGNGHNTHSSQDSVEISTGRTNGTSSTRKSENVGTLAPDAVAHLIGDQVGGMTFDQVMQRWVRVSKSPHKDEGEFLEPPSHVTSEDDPFREISDLPVDEQKERRAVSSPGKVAETTEKEKHLPVDAQTLDRQLPNGVPESRTTSQDTVVPRPVTRDSSHIRHNHSSSVPSRYTAFNSSQQNKVETRATSWSDEEMARLSALEKQRQYASLQAHSVHNAETLDASEDLIAGDAAGTTPLTPSRVSQGRLSGSSDEEEQGFTGLRDDTVLDAREKDIDNIASPKLRQSPPRPSMPMSTTHQKTARQTSLRRKTLTSRWNADAREQSELSIIAPLPGDRMMSLSLSVSRPVTSRRQHQITELPSSPTKGGSSILLSDLPDFTVHDDDPERPSERALATRLAHHAAAEVNDRYALAVKELVKILTDVNEDEPYWEDLKYLDLRDRNLASVYGLDDFCVAVRELDVSRNSLTHLHGAPISVRRLNARSNQLSSLTSWTHLMNLQYIDISGNRLDSLDGLGCLIHLRELRAEDNEISRLDGIFELDGLMKLRLRRNKLKHIDFGGCQLMRLGELDLRENGLCGLERVEELQSLNDLKLDRNLFPSGLGIRQPMPQLKSLSMGACDVGELDVSAWRHLTSLDVDDNRLANIRGLDKLKGLQTLSVRRQSLPKDAVISIFDKPLEAQTIRLSGNAIPTIHLSHSFLNLQHLEMTSVGLQTLPGDFGLRMPNLRTLNLNFNSLKDVRPLLNIHKLEKLSLCGNRLHRLRKSVATFERLPSLEALDIRDNPLTQGFYANVASTLSRNTSLIRKAHLSNSENEDTEAASIEQARHELPPCDLTADKQHLSRMDEDVCLRRRVYELLMANSCGSLRELDGRVFDKDKATVKDWTWNRLMQLGIIRKSQISVA